MTSYPFSSACRIGAKRQYSRLVAMLLILGFISVAFSLRADDRTEVLDATLKPYTGVTVKGVDASTLIAKMMCGYQGWFNTGKDGAGFGWKHWSTNGKEPNAGNIRVDMWPDVSELTPAEREPTALRLANGEPAELFSSFRRETVLRHFRWMREYGIDGVFVQRFIANLRDPRALRHDNVVLGHCREGANSEGRVYSVMYDLSGLGAGRMAEVQEDWRALRERMRVADDGAYLHHRGKPLVAVWGVGFSDQRAYTLAECRQLIEFLKKDGCAVMLGVPAYWRELKRDALADPALHDIMRLADVISPWTVGRYGDDAGVHRHAREVLAPDLEWCRQHQLDYLPVVFPGFSWHNMNRKAKLDAIPRRGGQFLWSQLNAALKASANMLYVAMFDEVDEATAIFKYTDNVPQGEGIGFVTPSGVPNDHYLTLTGLGARMLRHEIPLTETPPQQATPIIR
ncbi:MAG: glycoside hydrolase family 71/99-like protein [Verrucomicrobiota bacterium]